jgi:hypothetical protein
MRSGTNVAGFLLRPAQETLGARLRRMGEVSERRAVSVHCKARLLSAVAVTMLARIQAHYPGFFGWST